jgi:FKBP-type peptidyl-prolyl cis-trans isomerase SlyD
MEIERGKVVTFSYRVTNPEGQLLEASDAGRPAVYLHGHGSIVRGLESKMRGHKAGDSFAVTIPPEHAYGMYDPSSRRRVPIKHLIRPGRLERGRVVTVNARQGQARGVVLKVGKFNVDVDFNHPLAGLTLVFDVQVLDVRDATPEEAAHRHVHGPGGVTHG